MMVHTKLLFRDITRLQLIPFENYHIELIISTLSILFFVILIFLVIFLINRRAKKKLNLQLNEQKEKIGQQTFYLEKANHELKEYSEELKQQREEIKAQAESLETALKNLRELVEFKEGLVGMMVHDLKNPLNIILNSSKDTTISHAGWEMLNMVNNILDVQKYETTKMPVDFEVFNHNIIVNGAISKVAHLINQKEITVSNLTSSDIALFADIELTKRIYINLLTNAIKYTPKKGEICIDANYDTNQSVKVCITDTGPGIPEALKDRVFDKFTQIIAKKSGYTRSTGLGLTFCKLAIEAHGGKIGIESKAGEGTTFWFTMPSIQAKNVKAEESKNIFHKNPAISNEIISVIQPFIQQLKAHKVYEVSQIQKYILKIKSLEIIELYTILEALENAAYSVNQEEYDKLLNILDTEK